MPGADLLSERNDPRAEVEDLAEHAMGVMADLDVVDEDGLHLFELHRSRDEGKVQDILAESLNEDVEEELIGHLVKQELFEAIALAEVRTMRGQQLTLRHVDAISVVTAAAQAAGHSFAQALGEGLDCILSCHADR